MKKCERRELENCPYREEEIDYAHWVVRAERSLEFAKKRAILLCKSVPCMYAIELNSTNNDKFDAFYQGYVIRERHGEYFVGPDSDRYRVALRAHAARFTKDAAVKYIKNGCFCDPDYEFGGKRKGDLGFTFDFVIEDAT